LQKAKREQAARRGSADEKNGGPADDHDGAVFGGPTDKREIKRRKVNNGSDDPFGGPL
jgi:hypothetical protein